MGTKINDEFGAQLIAKPVSAKLSMICGTSACLMGLSESPLFVPGIWGPYYEAIFPGMWLNEAGQTAVL